MEGGAASFNHPHDVWSRDAIWPFYPLHINTFFVCRILKSIDVDVYLCMDLAAWIIG